MTDSVVRIAGQVADWPTKDQMAAILQAAGLRVYVEQYSVRVEDCSHFVFQEYGGDLGKPQIDADAESLEQMLRDATLVSDALARAGIRHRFGLYNDDDELLGYLHHCWPQTDER